MKERLRAWARRPGLLAALLRIGLSFAALDIFAVAWFFVQAIAFFAFSKLVPLPISFVTQQLFTLFIFVMGLLALPVLYVVYVMTHHVEQRPFASVGLRLSSHLLKEFLSGLALGIMLASIGFLAAYWSGVFQIAWDPAPLTLALLVEILFLALGWFGVAFWEELFFRGYLLQTLASGIGLVPATLISSLAFGFLHAATYGMKPLLLLNATFLGIVLAALYLKAKSLWAPVGMHFANNFWLFHVLQAPILQDMRFPFVTVNRKPVPLEPLHLLWQAEFVEGKGFADLYSWTDLPSALAFYGLLILLIWKLPWFRARPEMEVLWQQYVPIAQPWAHLKSWWARHKQAARDQRPPAS